MPTEKPARPGIIPTIHSPNCDKHIAWIRSVFNAEQDEIYRSKDEKTIMHCSLIINRGYIYLCDSFEKKGSTEDVYKDSKGTVLHLELEDPNPFWKSALTNGATVIEELKQQFWGGTYGSIRDPFGFVWGLMKGGDCRKLGVIPYLILDKGKCEAYIEWLVKAFGGEVKDKFTSDDKNLIQHCSVEFNGGVVYLADDIKMAGQREGTSGITSDIVCHLDIPNPKTAWDKLLKNDAKIVMDLEVQFWGDLYGEVRDYIGYQWSISKTHLPKPSRTANGIISHIVSPDCEKHIKWIEQVLSGEVNEIMHTTNKKVMHCSMSVNGGTLMLCDKFQDSTPADGVSSTDDEPQGDQKGFILHLNVPDPDLVWKKAMENGGVQVMELKKQFWGGYYGQFQDPFGYQWGVLKS